MTTLNYAISDSATMFRRQLKRAVRYPGLTLFLLVIPIAFLLLFVYVFGGTLGDGLGAAAGGGGRAAYANYVMPGILLMTLAMGANLTAVSVAMDMTEGIVARFRTMAIARVSVLTGHVLGSVSQALIASAVMVGIGVLVGFRPTATVVEWFAAAGLVALVAFAFTWLSVAIGLVAKTVESASNLPQPLVFLPFLGSGFVPTDSLPSWLRWFAEHQPFTPWMETLRGLLLGTPIGSDGIVSVGWAAGIALAGYLWAKRRYNRDPVR
ncbi:MAG TPA: ABC transporter permease [Natronosporangium sp.]